MLRSVALTLKESLDVVRIEIGLCFEITEIKRVCGPEVNVSKDAAQPPLILILQIAAVRILKYLDCEEILARSPDTA